METVLLFMMLSAYATEDEDIIELLKLELECRDRPTQGIRVSRCHQLAIPGSQRDGKVRSRHQSVPSTHPQAIRG